MKNLIAKKVFLIALAALMIFNVPIGAAGADGQAGGGNTITVNAVPDTATGVVTVSGRITPEGVSDFTLVILKSGVEPGTITNENLLTKVDFISVGTTGADGTFSVMCLPMSEWSGSEQQVIVSSKGLGYGIFAYVTDTIEDRILEEIKNASADDIGHMLSGERLVEGKTLVTYLGISLTDYEAIIDKDVVHDSIAGKEFDTIKVLSETLLSAIESQKKLEDENKADAELLNKLRTSSDEEMDALLRENADKLSLTLDDEYGYTYLKGLYDDGLEEALKDVYADIRKVTSLTEVAGVMDSAVVLAAVNTADWQILDKVLAAYQAELGIDSMEDFEELSQSDKSDLLRDMAKIDFNSPSEVKKQFENLIDDYSDTKKGGSSGGGGNGGGSGSGSGTGNVTLPLVPNTVAEAVEFTDIDTVAWAAPAINYLSEKKIINGYPDGSFRPNEPVLREEFAKMLVLALGLYDSGSTCQFSDVPEDSWYYKYVASAYQAELVKGMGEAFGAGMYITREDAATMIYRAAVMMGKSLGEGRIFADNDLISDYAKDAVNALGGTIITGDENGYFNPKDITTRAQAAKMIYQLLQ